MTQESPRYMISIIIPAFNLEPYIAACLESLEKQTADKSCYEVVIIDDCSSDNTLKKIKSNATSLNLKIAQTEENSGPGIARNKGISLAKGKYILFLDGDDLLVPGALERLCELMQKHDYDLITYNWTYFSDLAENQSYRPRRRDLKDMPLERKAIIPHYLGMNMDGSVIYTTAKKSLFEDYQIRFPGGYHEDMAIIFEMYYAANTILKLDEVLYIKKNVETSIVNTLSKKHVDGYLNAWPTIIRFLAQQEGNTDDYMPDYLKGMSGHVCTLINKNYAINRDNFENRVIIYNLILEALERDSNLDKPYAKSFPNVTEKDKITQLFLTHMSVIRLPLEERAVAFEAANGR